MLQLERIVDEDKDTYGYVHIRWTVCEFNAIEDRYADIFYKDLSYKNEFALRCRKCIDAGNIS